jgi:glycosyltransferase involved in cell wall biosynthesis
MNNDLLSVVIPVANGADDFSDLFESYHEALVQTGRDFEFLFVLDGPRPHARVQLEGLRTAGYPIRIFEFAKSFGEAAALTVGFEHARGDVLLTLPSRFQVESSSLPRLLEALEDRDMVITRRWPRTDSGFSRAKTWVFNRLVGIRNGNKFHDLGCSVRILRKAVAEEIPLYGDQDPFLPLLAQHKGFVVQEIDLPQSRRAPYRRPHGFGVYIRRLLDVLTVFFLTKFTRKPLRFFGLIGVGIALIGLLSLLYVVVERLLFGEALADRPALLLSSLMFVLGVQVLGLGLIAELVIFSHARELKEYQVREIVNGRAEPAVRGGSRSDTERRDSAAVPDPTPSIG